MKIPNGFFGNGPGRDEQNTRDQDAYLRNRMQMTVATSTFAGVALVGMFCSCIWFACCRNSSSKTRKKARTWATANPEGGVPNPYSYDGYMDGQGGYMQMDSNTDSVAPYMNPPCSMYGDNGLTNPYDFNDHFGFNQGGKAQMSTLFGGPTSTYPTGVNGTNETSLKDVPPSYTALFFAASDPSTGIGGKGSGATGDGQSNTTTDTRVTSIQPIHLRVTSSAEQQRQRKADEAAAVNKMQGYRDLEDDDMEDDFVNMKADRSLAPVSLLSVESDPGKEGSNEEDQDKKSNDNDKKTSISGDAQEKPPPYNPGYNNNMSYMKF